MGFWWVYIYLVILKYLIGNQLRNRPLGGIIMPCRDGQKHIYIYNLIIYIYVYMFYVYIYIYVYKYIYICILYINIDRERVSIYVPVFRRELQGYAEVASIFPRKKG